ncbi:alpha/beta hydrolase [Rhodococcus sp. X156]|uniref:alpha/beta fold hydrolase n=1 Tax=Rhodococcus sp. X156 TaxID=2499145 RepID=UPI000FD9B754|nr:alpha/beta hydrolase [Rhodococcus sp. X156]
MDPAAAPVSPLGWEHHYARINGLDVHYVEQGQGPLVVLLHGFPHTSFSWRHQIGVIADAGYRVVAPDLRGMGQTSAPTDGSGYGVDAAVGDLVGLLDHLGEEQAVFSGLDFGGMAAYDLAYHHPERMRAVIGLQNPFISVGSVAPSVIERKRGAKRFNHMSYYLDQPEAAAQDYAAHPREILAKIFHALSGTADFTQVWQHPPGTSYREALPQPPPLPWSWMSEWELETYVADYARSGFAGGIGWYLALDDVWEHRKSYTGPSTVPFYFIGSENDIDLAVWHGRDPVNKLSDHHADVRGKRMIDGAGHMLNMECPDEVSEAYVAFLDEAHGR